MPTYGYRCTECSTEFELWQSMHDDARADCPACGAPGRRLFFPAGIVFKGTGFYKTDSRGASGGSSGTAATPAAATPAAGAPPSEDGGTAPARPAGSGGTGTPSSAAKDTAGSGTGSAPATPSKGE